MASSTMTSAKNFKCVLVGDGAVGKSSFLRKLESTKSDFYYRLYQGGFEEQYIATIGIEVANLGHFTVWDCAGRPELGGLRDGYYLGGECAMVMFDVTNRGSFEHVNYWIGEVKRVCGNIPIVVVGNKADREDRVVQASEVVAYPYFELSVKSGAGVEQPLEYLTSRLV